MTNYNPEFETTNGSTESPNIFQKALSTAEEFREKVSVNTVGDRVQVGCVIQTIFSKSGEFLGIAAASDEKDTEKLEAYDSEAKIVPAVVAEDGSVIDVPGAESLEPDFCRKVLNTLGSISVGIIKPNTPSDS